jgi:hypothetical protein
MTGQRDAMTDHSTYAVTLDALEAGVRVPIAALVETIAESNVPHDLPFEDMALGRAARPNR